MKVPAAVVREAAERRIETVRATAPAAGRVWLVYRVERGEARVQAAANDEATAKQIICRMAGIAEAATEWEALCEQVSPVGLATWFATPWPVIDWSVGAGA